MSAAGPNAPYTAAVVYVVDKDKRPLYDINADKQIPIASITKLMTAILILDANQSLEDQITIKQMDKDTIKNTNSRLNYGTKLTRKQLLLLALMSSENRAAAALVRNYPKGSKAAIKAMNKKAIELGMYNTKFVDGTGLSAKNVSTAKDLAMQTMQNNSKVMKTPEPVVVVKNLADTSILLALRPCASINDFADMTSEIMEESKEAFDKEGILFHPSTVKK